MSAALEPSVASQPLPTEPTGLEIAIVGMACRVPGAMHVEQFWQNLLDGVESITLFTEEELLALGEPLHAIRAPGYVRAARRIEDAEIFDAAFFGLSPREAEVMDPQQRLLLQCAWETLEHGGYDPSTYPGLVGVFAGTRLSNYLINLMSNPEVAAAVGDLQITMGNDKDYVATRIAYKLGLGGPALSVQTACSSSLVATHLACQSLLAGECDLALAGGVALRVPQAGYRVGEIQSSDGHIRAFDANADGTIFGNGLGFVLLKRLEEAERDGDRIYAVIRGSAINNDAALKVGFSAPGADGQRRVVKAAQQAAGVDAASISYIEAHGTGTHLGDPIEVNALAQVFRESTDERGFCGLGSVKTNIGHLAAASGVAGLIKTALALHHRVLPPSLNFERPNPQIDFAASPFRVVTETTPWQRRNGWPLRAGVSSFGIGGTNAHVVLEEAPAPADGSAARPWQLVVLSARTEGALETVTDRLVDHLERHPELALPDVAFTLRQGRKAFEHRRLLVARDRDDALAALRGRDASRLRGALVLETQERPIAFLFSGQGAQYPNMARALYEAEPRFREEVDQACQSLEPELGFDLRTLLFPAPGAEEAAGLELAKTANTQPALFVVEHALARLLESWGLVPTAMLGHSIGEYVAATLAGVMALPDALRLVAARGRLMQSLPSGSMLAVPLDEATIAAELAAVRLEAQVQVAAENAPERTVVSGPSQAVLAFQEHLATRGVKASLLHTSHAFHSAMLEPILPAFLALVEGIELHPPSRPYLSNLTGTWIRPEEATDPLYWARHLRERVRFSAGLGELLADPRQVLIEVGPGKTLAGFAQLHPARRAEQPVLTTLRHAKDRGGDDLAFLLGTFGQLWLHGLALDWRAFDHEERRLRVPLPTYPFEGRRYFIETNRAAMEGNAGLPLAARLMKKADLADWFYVPTWKPTAPVASSLVARGLGEPRRWLLLAEPGPLGRELAGRLAVAGHPVTWVEPGSGFELRGEDAYAVAPGSRADLERLVRELAEAGTLPAVVLHLLACGPAEATTPEARAGLVDAAFWSQLHLAQGLGRYGGGEPLRWLTVSSGVQAVDGSEAIVPERATLLGPAKVLPLEYPNFALSTLDVDLPAPGTAAWSELAELILLEAAAAPTELVTAYRGGARYALEHQAVRLPSVAPDELLLRRGGTYLITGGLGGIGLTFAEALARDWAARLVLLGLTPMPERERWAEILGSRPAHDRVSFRIRKIQELERMGAEVLVVAADVTDLASMQAAVAQAHARFGPIAGVIHSAGLAGGGIVQLKTRETAAKVLAPKVEGTRVLEQALADEPLDFLVLCSSMAAVLGPFGQVDYCAANSFLDAYARAARIHTDRGHDRPVVRALQWGAWEEVGMAVESGLARGAQHQAAVEDVHPLLERSLHELIDLALFETRFDPARHWVLGEHTIGGKPALPGTSYLEIARAAYAHHAAGFERHDADAGIEMSDVFFLSPLLVERGTTREARITLEREGERFAFRVASKTGTTASGEDIWQPHARGKVGPAPADSPRHHDLDALRARCAVREMAIEGPLMMDGASLVGWGPRWQSLKRVWAGDGEGLAELELPAELAVSDSAFVLHPALLDVATALLSFLESESYLPLSYRRVVVRKPLVGKLFSHLERHGDGKRGETVSADVLLLDEQGEELVRVEGFTMKRVGSEVQAAAPKAAKAAASPSQPVAAPPAQAATSPPASAQQGEGTGEGIKPEEGVEALRRVLSKRVKMPEIAITVRDLHAGLKQARSFTRDNLGGGAASARPRPAQTSRHPRPAIPTPFVAPTNETESRLAEVWQGVLGLEQVGVHDNFFDLGGDSVIGVQLIARANEVGYALSPEQLFEHQTVAELASLLGGSSPELARETEPEPAAAGGEDLDADLARLGLSPEALAAALGGNEAAR